MKLNKSNLLNAAVAGILGAAIVSHAIPAHAEDAAAGGTADAKGHCMGANACKGKGGCAQKGAHDCAGKNACKGKGFTETSKADCDAMAKKNKKIKFEAANG